jgi:hypothetical protein
MFSDDDLSLHPLYPTTAIGHYCKRILNNFSKVMEKWNKSKIEFETADLNCLSYTEVDVFANTCKASYVSIQQIQNYLYNVQFVNTLVDNKRIQLGITRRIRVCNTTCEEIKEWEHKIDTHTRESYESRVLILRTQCLESLKGCRECKENRDEYGYRTHEFRYLELKLELLECTEYLSPTSWYDWMKTSLTHKLAVCSTWLDSSIEGDLFDMLVDYGDEDEDEDEDNVVDHFSESVNLRNDEEFGPVRDLNESSLHTIYKVSKINELIKDDVCTVCQEQLSENEEKSNKVYYKTNCCGSTYHTTCLIQWLNIKNTCPICRTNLTL